MFALPASRLSSIFDRRCLFFQFLSFFSDAKFQYGDTFYTYTYVLVLRVRVVSSRVASSRSISAWSHSSVNYVSAKLFSNICPRHLTKKRPIFLKKTDSFLEANGFLISQNTHIDSICITHYEYKERYFDALVHFPRIAATEGKN